jgi:hypothetical protein
MLRHVVMFKLKEGAPADTLESLAEGLHALSQSISEISGYRYGPDLALREGNFDFCLVAEFADADAFGRYVVHPAHQAFVKDRLTPVVSERVAVQYEM